MDPTEDEAFRQNRIATIRQVRRYIVRISYQRKPGADDVIIAGTVVSKTGNACVIIANDTLHNDCKKSGVETCRIRFPTADEHYGAEVICNMDSDDVRNIGNYFIRLNLIIPPNAIDYVEPAIFETEDITPDLNVDVFMFPRANFPAPPIYSPGSIVDATVVEVGYFYADVPVDEYAHFGSALFNHRGHIVGIIFNSQSHVRAWSVRSLQNRPLSKLRARYAANGAIIPAEP